MRPYILSIAGFDPSAGAGILADIKTAEQCQVYGLGVNSAITFQNDEEFKGLDWTSLDNIIQQLEPLIEKYKINFAKIGLIENLDILSELVNYLSKREIKIIWDPILKASAGFEFHNDLNKDKLFNILKKIYLLTPNLVETEQLFGAEYLDTNKLWSLKKEHGFCNILVKGGHSRGIKSTDVLIANLTEEITGIKFPDYAKHGTGCVLSAAITSNLAKGLALNNACYVAKKYIEKFIQSNRKNLGYHHG